MDDSLLASEVKERGWTAGMIRQYAPPPLQKRRYGGGHYLLYPREAIEQAEATPEWQAAREKAAIRQAAAVRAAEAKRAHATASLDAVIAEMRQATLSLAVPDDVIDKAVAHYEGRGPNDDFRCADRQSSPPMFLSRITGNYLRHVCSNYEALLAQMREKIDAVQARQDYKRQAMEEAYAAVRYRFNDTIADALAEIFPDLNATDPSAWTPTYRSASQS